MKPAFIALLLLALFPLRAKPYQPVAPKLAVVRSNLKLPKQLSRQRNPLR